MNIVFRTDASQIIGTGHIIRCMTLAKVLRSKGANVSFICREHEGHLCDRLDSDGFVTHRLPLSSKEINDANSVFHSSWLGASREEDASSTCQLILSSGIRPDWLIVDHYSLDIFWESIVRPYVKKIFVIDDIADRKHDCDLLLDQNLVLNLENRYSDKVTNECKLLLGPEYALLQPIYAELNRSSRQKDGKIRRILLTFGGADNDNLTGLVLLTFIELNRMDIKMDVVIPEKFPFRPDIEKIAALNRNIVVHYSLPTLAHLMVEADLAIGAAGTTSWERLCLGLYTLVITLADNQINIAKGLQTRGLVCWLGHSNEVSKEMIKTELSKIIHAGIDESLFVKCRETVDGYGTERVASIMMESI